jgi:hypothetical protein
MTRHAAALAVMVALGGLSTVTAQTRTRRIATGHPAPACAGHPSADTTVRGGPDLTSQVDVRTAAVVPYNPRSIPRGEARVVLLRFVVRSDGSVDSSRVVVVSAEDSTFIPVARRQLLQMRFWPACDGDVAVNSWVQQRFRYVHQ